MQPQKLARYGAVAVIALTVGGVFTWREVLPSADEASAHGVTPGAGRPVLGQVAPDFVLEAPGTDEEVRLSDFRGRPVLLNFWATWCVPCRTEMPALQEAHDTEGVVVLAVNSQESDTVVSNFLDEYGLTFPAAIDREGSVRQHYGVLGLPATFFIDPDGILRARNFGPVYDNLLADGIEAAR